VSARCPRLQPGSEATRGPQTFSIQDSMSGDGCYEIFVGRIHAQRALRRLAKGPPAGRMDIAMSSSTECRLAATNGTRWSIACHVRVHCKLARELRPVAQKGARWTHKYGGGHREPDDAAGDVLVHSTHGAAGDGALTLWHRAAPHVAGRTTPGGANVDNPSASRCDPRGPCRGHSSDATRIETSPSRGPHPQSASRRAVMLLSHTSVALDPEGGGLRYSPRVSSTLFGASGAHERCRRGCCVRDSRGGTHPGGDVAPDCVARASGVHAVSRVRSRGRVADIVRVASSPAAAVRGPARSCHAATARGCHWLSRLVRAGPVGHSTQEPGARERPRPDLSTGHVRLHMTRSTYHFTRARVWAARVAGGRHKCS
jgi:hypothetical protein